MTQLPLGDKANINSDDEFVSAINQLYDKITSKTLVTVGHNRGADFITSNYESDDLAIQAALDSLGDTGGEVKIKEGTYTIENSIVIDSYQSLIGAGAGSTILVAKNSLNADIIKTPTTGPMNYVVLKDFKIDGNRGGNTTGKAVNLFSPRHCYVTNLFMTEIEEHCVYLAGDESNLGWFNVIENCHFTLADDGIEFRFCEHNWIRNNTISWIIGKGIWVKSDMDMIVDNQLDHCGGYSIHCYFGAGLWTVCRNYIDRPQDHGVVIEGADKSIVMNNYFDSLLQNKTAILNAGSDYCTVTGNRIHQSFASGTYGIRESAATEYCSYTHNIVTGATNGVSIHASSTNVILKDNTGATNNQAEGYTLIATHASNSPSDGGAQYFGSRYAGSPTSGAGVAQLLVPKAGIVKAAFVQISVTGTLGTTETATIAVRLNDTTDYTITAAATYDATQRVFNNQAMAIPVVAGDLLEIKVTNPTWATNPTTVIHHVTLYIE